MAYLAIRNKINFYEEGTQKVEIIAKQHALEIEQQFNKYFSLLRTLANTNKSIELIKKENRQNIILENYKNVLNDNVDIDGVWDSWDFYETDSNNIQIEKRISYSAEKSNNLTITRREIRKITEAYDKIRKEEIENVVEPYLYSFSGDDDDEVLVTSLTEKMFINNKQVGVVGIDISLKNIQNILKKIEKSNQEKTDLISYEGQYLSSSNEELIGKNAFNKNDTLSVNKVKEGNEFSIIVNENDEELFKAYVPIELGNCNKHWMIAISVPKALIEEKANDNFILTMIIGLIGILILSLIVSLVTTPIIAPIKKITKLLEQLSKGDVNNVEKVKYKSKNEVGIMILAVNNMIDDIKDKADFASEIGNNNLKAKLAKLNDKDDLGKALINMRDNLKHAEDIETERKTEEDKRQWANKGEALFAKILRTNNDNLSELNDILLKNIIKYTESNQGGIFLVNENEKEKSLKLVSTYAYDRKKYTEKDILFGEGLVGTCAIEGLSIYLTDIPDNYINITSGLGKANPKALLIVPLKTDTELIGIIEIASFKNIEKYQIEFIEKLAKNIASTIVSVKINEKTNILLEQTQQQAEEMQAQEEEMRQNMEELQATQEEADRKSNEMKGFVDYINETNYIAEYNTEGNVIEVNKKLVNLLQIPKNEIIGKHHSDSLILSAEQEEEYEQLWIDLNNGKNKSEIFKYSYNNKEFTFKEDYIPIKNTYDKVLKIIKVSNEIDL
jgi:methyl-accepting chemotaxis protein